MPLDGSRFELPLPASVVALDKARALLGPNGENWIQGPFAVNAAGEPVDKLDPSACRFCSKGARWHLETDSTCSTEALLAVGYAIDYAAREMGYPSAVGLNDRLGTTFPLVDRMWSRAREILMAEAHARETVL